MKKDEISQKKQVTRENKVNQKNQKTAMKSEHEAQETNKENKENEESGKNKEKENSFAHLQNASKVIIKNKNKNLMGFMVGSMVLLVIFILMISGGHHQTVIKQDQAQTVNNDLIFQQNEERIQALQNQPVSMPSTPNNFSGISAQADNKEMMARRNAPTQMYTLSGSDLEKQEKQNDLPASGIASGNRDGDSTGQNHMMAGKDELSRFANAQSDSAPIVSGGKIAHPEYTIAEGELIPAVLETAINSDLPGMVRAVVTRPIYAYTGEKPLIPEGSRLVGQYASMASNGAATERVLVMWNRVITPSGISMMINSPGSDSLGRAGIGANVVNTHFFRIFGTAALLSVMGATAATSGVGSYDQPNSANMYRQSIAEAFQESAQASLSQNLNIKPTLHIYQGTAINVFVAKDVDLYGVLG